MTRTRFTRKGPGDSDTWGPCTGHPNDPRTDDLAIMNRIDMLWSDLSAQTAAGEKARRKVAERMAKKASAEEAEILLNAFLFDLARMQEVINEIVDEAIVDIVDNNEDIED